MKKLNAPCCILLLCLVLTSCAPKQEKNDLPAVVLIERDGRRFSAATLPGNSVLIFFGATCDHCQREARQIHDHLEGFEKYTLYFISMDPFPVMDQFAADYGINNQSNIRFLQADGATVASALGYIKTPTIIVFDDNRKLIKRFDGETKVEDILDAL